MGEVGGVTKMDAKVLSEGNASVSRRGSAASGGVSFARLDPVQPRFAPLADVGDEEFEIAIGSWSVTIVKQVEERSERVRLKARIERAQGKTWNRRRKRRLQERLKARRRFPD